MGGTNRASRVQRALRAATALTAAWSLPAHAQAITDTQRNARLDALEAQMRQIQVEIAALRKATPGVPASQTPPAVASAAPARTAAPTSSGTATLGQTGTVQAAQAVADKGGARIFGPGVPSSAAVSRIDSGRPVIATTDGRFTASLLGVMQFDVADYFQTSPGPLATDLRRAGAAADNARGRNLSDGSVFRRARIGIAGKAFGDFDYTVLFDFGGSGLEDNGHVQELWVQYSGWKPAHIRVGAFPPFIGLEDSGATNGMPFLERPTSVDIARGLAGGDYREAGQIAFTGGTWFASGAVTGRLVNTAGASGVQPYRSQLGFIGRAGFLPVKTADTILHLGAHGSYVDHPANTGGPDATATTAISPIQFRERPELRVDGTRLIDTGAIDAAHAYTAGAEAAFQHRNLLVQGEYDRLGIERRASALADPHFKGYYVEGSWIITGEKRRYNDGNYVFDGPQVKNPFDPLKGQWGAWEVALRWSDMDLNYRAGAPGSAIAADGVRGGEQKILSAALNLYLNSVARVMLDYQHVTIDRLSPNPTTYVTPVGAEIGQTYNALAARFQLAF